jgi:hypothetical protein
VIGHETYRTGNDGEILRRILAYIRSSLIYLPWAIEKLQSGWNQAGPCLIRRGELL